MNDTLIARLRTACSPESPLGKLCSEAADVLEKAQIECPIGLGHASQFCSAMTCLECLISRMRSAEARLKQAEELLKPFAGQNIHSTVSDDRRLSYPLSQATVGDIRAARRFLESASNGGSNDK